MTITEMLTHDRKTLESRLYDVELSVAALKRYVSEGKHDKQYLTDLVDDIKNTRTEAKNSMIVCKAGLRLLDQYIRGEIREASRK